MDKLKGIIVIFVTVLVVFLAWTFAPQIRGVINKKNYDVQKVDDATNYKTLKEVENTCRAMISSYNADKLVYEQYKGSEDKQEHSWAEQAKMRANKTASTYNNYILKNSFVWKDNVPSDIYQQLEVIQ